MKRTLRLCTTELEKLLKQWAIDHDLIGDSELVVDFAVHDGSVTSVTLTCESDDLPQG